MANRTVQILGGELDGVVIENAASEATLQEIINAVNSINKKTSGKSGNQNTQNNNQSARTRSNEPGLAKKAFDKGVKGIGLLAGTTANIAGLVTSGSEKLSEYTQVLNNGLLKNVPLIGSTLGAFGDILVEGIRTLEGWNDTLKKSSQFGASFNNSIVQMRMAASEAYVGLDEYTAILAKHSKSLPTIGGTATEGAMMISRYTGELYRTKLGQDLLDMGMTTSQVADGMAHWLSITQRGIMNERLTAGEATKGFVEYQKNLLTLSKMTGENVEVLQQKAEKEKQNVAFQLAMNRLNPIQRSRMMQQLETFRELYGEAGAELFRSVFLGIAPQTEAAQILQSLNPHLLTEARNAQRIAQDKNQTDTEYADRIRRTRAESLLKSVRSGKQQEALYAMIASGAPGMKDIGNATESLNRFMLRFGDASKMTIEDMEDYLRTLERENDTRDGFTRLLNAFGLSAQDFQNSVIHTLLPALEEIGSVLEREGVPEKLKMMGTELGNLVGQHLPDVIGFFEEMFDENGQKKWQLKVDGWLNNLKIELKWALRRIFMNIDEEAYKKELEDAKKQTEESLAAVPAASTPIADAARAGYNAYRAGQTPGGPSGRAGPITGGRFAAPSEEARAPGLNGRLPDNMLAPVGESGHRLNPAAAQAYIAMREAARAQGVNLSLTDSYRTYAAQVDVRARKGAALTAEPGKSNHGWGLAVDVNLKKDPKLLDWLKANAHNYGWKGPLRNPNEDWHWEYKGQGMSTGTLGTMGQLFGNFGNGTPVTLHGKEAVITPDQFSDIMKTGGDVSLTEMINDLNSKMNSLISIYKEKLNVNKSHLETLRQQSGNMIHA